MPTPKPIYQHISQELDRYHRLNEMENPPVPPHEVKMDLEDFVKKHLPSGGGIDSGTELDFDLSKPDKLVFTFGYHFMNDGGFYDGWEHYKLYVRPSLMWEINLKLHGPNRRMIKDYLFEMYQHALTQWV